VFGLALNDRVPQEIYGQVTFRLILSYSSIGSGFCSIRKGWRFPEKAAPSTEAVLQGEDDEAAPLLP
jgi:hypothetical protein